MSITAMKTALEALKDVQDFKPNDKTADAITALRAAIKDAEKQAPVATYTCGVCGVSMQMETPAAQRQPLTEIAEALRRHGLTLVKTAKGYDVLRLGEISGHGIKEQA